MAVRHVRVEVKIVDPGHCDPKCNWWCPGLGGRGGVCSLFETTLQKGSGQDYVRTQQCREQEVALT